MMYYRKVEDAWFAEPTIDNTNLFSSVGHRVARIFSHHEASAMSPDESARLVRVGRDLKAVLVTRADPVNNSSDVANTWWRHHRHHHSGERHPHHRTPHPKIVTNVTVTPPQQHTADTCYGPNQVLLIIAVTCAVNFAFIFGVMTIVHLCNVRGRSGASAHEALTSIVSVGHVEALQCEEKLLLRHSSCSSGLENSLPGSMSMLLMPELEDTTPGLVRHAWHHSTWQQQQQPPPPRCRLSTQYQPLLAHSMEDLHILE
ncbi:hypothetical protein B566_EDAN011053 [Ephemera danica]|nr:hypothetical protein B566_EDAN011053 [Ephemera danica]